MYLSQTDKNAIKSFLTETFIDIKPIPPEEYPRIIPKRCYIDIRFDGKSLGVVSAPKNHYDMREDEYKAIVADSFLEQASDTELKNVLKEVALYEEYIEEQIMQAKSQVNVM